MNYIGQAKKHLLILPVCWLLMAACWSLPFWKYSHSTYTFGGNFIMHLVGYLPGHAEYLLGFAASAIEVAAIALALSFLRVPVWIYAVTPIVPVYTLAASPVVGLREQVAQFGLYSACSFYLTALFALAAFSAFSALCGFRKSQSTKTRNPS